MRNRKTSFLLLSTIIVCLDVLPFSSQAINPVHLESQKVLFTINANEKIILEFSSSEEEGPMAEAKLIKNNQTMSRVKFRPVGTPDDYYEISGKNLGDKGLAGHPWVISFTFAKAACDYLNGEVLLILKDNKLLYGATASGCSTDDVINNYRYIFPKDKGGKPDRLIIISTFVPIKVTGNLGSPDYKHAKYTKEVYQWNGIKMVNIPNSAR